MTKRDRTARLVRVEHLLYQHPDGLTARELSERVGVNVRTVYRDLRALQEELGFPIWEERGRFGALPTAFLPPLNLTLSEAVTLFLSARLMARFQDHRDDNVVHAFGSLAAVLPSPIAQHVYSTVAALGDQPTDARFSQVFELLVRGWAEGRKVLTTYSHRDENGKQNTSKRTLCPYFIEPHPSGHGLYVFAHDSQSKAVRTFKVERILSANLTDEHFVIPSDFNPHQRLRDSWIVTDDDPITIRLLFHDSSASERAQENRWHTSQTARVRQDGKLELRFKVAGLVEILSWVLGWGDAVEVLEPSTLRQRVAEITQSMAARYR